MRDFMWETSLSYGTLPGWVKVLAEEAYAAGVREGKSIEKRRSKAYAKKMFPPKGFNRCEAVGCYRKATWDVCRSNGAGTLRCGLHNKGDGMTLKMFRVK